MIHKLLFLLFLLNVCAWNIVSCTAQDQPSLVSLDAPLGTAVACFAEGCFWCSEHIFEAVVGVDSVISGYAGGHTTNPTYKNVSGHRTGHAESVLVYYQPSLVNYGQLCDVFFTSHDPTTPNRQGPDVGASYRSIIFYQSEKEHAIIKKKMLQFAPHFKNPIVTEIKLLRSFYKAEMYHQDYVERNPSNPYVKAVSIPRFMLFRKRNELPLKY